VRRQQHALEGYSGCPGELFETVRNREGYSDLQDTRFTAGPK
jgi:hypothetical protein